MTQHTPTPWHFIRYNEIDECLIWEKQPVGKLSSVRIARDLTEYNAAHIVKCVNAHDELVEALEELVLYNHFPESKNTRYATALEIARAILEKVRS